MNVLVFGCNGQLGKCLQDLAVKFGIAHSFNFKFLDSKTGDIQNEVLVESVLTNFSADIVINAAAYTAVDKAETDVDSAYAVNAKGPENIAKVSAKIDIPFIHVSTDYVFDGNATQPYQINSKTNPQGVYGDSKLAGELAIQKNLTKHVIIRTAWVFSEYGNNFVKTMLHLAKDRDELEVVVDQHGCPTYAGDLAKAILDITLAIKKGNSNWGIFHYCGDAETTWHGFAFEIFALGVSQGGLTKQPIVNAISTDAFHTPAKRPAYSVMDSNLIQQQWQVNACDWKKSLQSVISKLAVQ